MTIGKAIANVYNWAGYTNGRIPYDKMVRLDDIPGNWFAANSMYAHPETAARVRWIYAECQRQGLTSVRPNEIYRDYDTQVFWKQYWTARGKPGNAATAGGSPHGYGYACDWDYAPEHYAAFRAIVERAGGRFNIDGEDWHESPLADSTVDLTDLGDLIATITTSLATPQGAPTMYLANGHTNKADLDKGAPLVASLFIVQDGCLPTRVSGAEAAEYNKLCKQDMNNLPDFEFAQLEDVIANAQRRARAAQ